MGAEFEVSAVAFSAGKAGSVSRVVVPSSSGVVAVLGSGANQYKSHLARWQASDVRGTSRAMFSSFCEFLSAQSDPHTGGPPQLAGLLRKGPAKSFGTIWTTRGGVVRLIATTLSLKSAIRRHFNAGTERSRSRARFGVKSPIIALRGSGLPRNPLIRHCGSC
jgi:hypothetical protein